MPLYTISEFAHIRRNEMVHIPDKFEVNESFLQTLNKEAFVEAFKIIKNLFYKLFTDIADDPAKFGLSTYQNDQGLGGSEYNEARIAADNPFYLLLYIFSNGTIEEDNFIVDVYGFRQLNKGAHAVKHTNIMLKALAEYGFSFDGLKEYKIPNNAKIFKIRFQDNPYILTVLHLIAEKCCNFLGKHGFIRFRTWNYRLLTEAQDKLTFGFGGDHVADSLHNKTEKEFVLAFHDSMMANGLICATIWTHEGPHSRYYEKNKQNACLFEITLDKDHVTLRLRIRNADACMEYLEQCPESIKEMFRENHLGCEKRYNGTCVTSTRYMYEGEEKWRCGCWGAAFFAPLIIENIPHYIRLVEIGKKKEAK